MEAAPGGFDNAKSFRPQFHESITNDGVRDELKLAYGGHTFVYALDAAEGICTLERAYSADGDEINPDDLTLLQSQANERAHEKLTELEDGLGEQFA